LASSKHYSLLPRFRSVSPRTRFEANHARLLRIRCTPRAQNFASTPAFLFFPRNRSSVVPRRQTAVFFLFSQPTLLLTDQRRLFLLPSDADWRRPFWYFFLAPQVLPWLASPPPFGFCFKSPVSGAVKSDPEHRAAYPLSPFSTRRKI